MIIQDLTPFLVQWPDTVVGRLATAFRLSVRELTLLLILFAVTLPGVSLRLYASDEVQYYSYLRSLWFDRDVSFDNEFRHFYDAGVARTEGFRETFLEPSTSTGLRRTFATIGPAILWAPLYSVADVGVRIARAFGSDVAADGFSKPYIAAVCVGSAVYGFLALLLSIRIARDLTGSGARAALAVWFGTPLLFYMYVAPGFAHATSAFAVALFIATWLRVRAADWPVRGVALLAASGALMTMVREQDAFLVAGPVVDYAGALLPRMAESRDAREQKRMVTRMLAAGVLALVTFIAVWSPQLAAYQALDQRFGPSPLVSRKMIWWSPHALQVLFSPEHGFVFWTPLAVAAFAGLVWLAVRQPPHRAMQRRVAVALLVMAVANIYVSGSVDSWSAAGAFGQRRFVNITPLLVIGLAVLFARARDAWPRRMLAAIVAVCVWWNLALMAQFGANLMNRQRLELGRNAYTAFVALPTMAPQLAYRYLFDRASFYQPPAR